MKTILEIMGESSVRAIISALMTACVLQGLRVKSRGIRHHAWAGVLMARLCLPLFSIWAPRIAIRVLPALSIPAAVKPLSLVAESWRAPMPNISVRESAAQDAPLLPKLPIQSRVTNQSTLHRI